MRRNGAPCHALIELPTQLAEVQGNSPSRRTTNLISKENGDKSMFVKRKTTEDVYVVVPQRLNDKVKARLLESESPVMETHILR